MSSHCHHHHQIYSPSNRKIFFIALLLTLGFAVVEAFGGWFAGSLTLLGDAGHMASDTLALAMAGIASWVACCPPSKRHTYGFGRAEVIGAWFSSLLMIFLVIGITVEAIERFHNPQPVASGAVIIIALVGLIVNITVAWILGHGEKTLNVRAAMLHVLGDILGSIAALISGMVIYLTHWNYIDPILSLFIAGLILLSTIKLLHESLTVLMEGVPKHISTDIVQAAILDIELIESVHDLHIWTLSSGVTLLTAHIGISSYDQWEQAYKQLCHLLRADFSIDHITIQPETSPTSCYCYPDDAI
jgi:cobalt-zinc-cadmium efflux system protein